MATPEPEADAARRYDLYVRRSGAGMSFRMSDCGVTPTKDGLFWIADGQEDSVPWSNVAAINLQTGGDAKSPVAMCVIRLADGYSFTVYDGNAYGNADAGKAALYRDFIRDLHARVTASPDAKARFSSGHSEVRHHVAFIATIVLGLIVVVGPFVMLLITHDWHVLLGLPAGGFLIYPMIRMVVANTPRTYDPRRVPDDVVS